MCSVCSAVERSASLPVMDIAGEVMEMVPLVGTVLQKLMTISDKVQDGLNQKNDAKIVFVDLKRRINQAEEVLTFLKPRLEGDDALCANPLLRATVEALLAHTDEAAHHVEKWDAYWRISKAGQKGKRRIRLMQEAHGKIFQVSRGASRRTHKGVYSDAHQVSEARTSLGFM